MSSSTDLPSVVVTDPEPGIGKPPLLSQTLTPFTREGLSDEQRVHDDVVSSSNPPADAPKAPKRSGASAQKMSAMEEESVRERLRSRLLRQCADLLLAQDVTASAAAGIAPRFGRDAFRRLFQEKELLELMFRLFDQDQDDLLMQEDWIEFLKQRLTNERHLDLAEQVESVAYVLCGDGPIDLHRFYQIFHAKGVVEKMFRMVDVEGTGSVSPEQIMEFISNLTNSRPRVGFNRSSLEWLERLFRETVGDRKEICREDFNKIVVSKNSFFTERVFQIFDKDNSGTISLPEFIDAMHQFSGKTPDDKIRFLFKVYDLDGDGLIQHRELQHVMRACMEENGMHFSEEQVSDLTMAMFEDADPDGRGAITYEALKNQLGKHEGLLENLSISIDRWLVPPKPPNKPTSLWGKLQELKPYQLSKPYLKNNHVFLISVAVMTLVNLFLFFQRIYEYRNATVFLMLARATGQCLNFNCTFVLVLMLRHCITFLRTRGFSLMLPLDSHIYFHKATGVLIFIYSAIHTVMHLINFTVIVVNDPHTNVGNYTVYEWLFTTRPGKYGIIDGVANPTGVALVAIVGIMFLCSQAFVRRGGCFEVFYWTHLLYIPFWGLLLFHGPNFWKWFLVPGALYAAERVLRILWTRSGRGKTYISSGLLLPSRVTHLVIRRPKEFHFRPGDYVFVNIPSIASSEWHPFTISSAPEQEDYMWLHIRAVGEWTNQLYNYFEREQEKLTNVSGVLPSPDDPVCPSSNPTCPVQNPGPSSNVAAAPATGLRRLHASLKRKFSNKDVVGNNKKVGFPGVSNAGFVSEETRPECPATSTGTGPTPLTDKRLERLLQNTKGPLSKSLSMPDMDNRTKKKERILALREYTRSESAKSFNESEMKRARLRALGLAYLSPQNKSLAHSFRYMRHKPTIIAFKTPSLESCHARLKALAAAGDGPMAATASSQTKSSNGGADGNGVMSAAAAAASAEEGRTDSFTSTLSQDGLPFGERATINYPVGKPLEIYLDGPYGAPSSHIFRAQHAVLIATGIGVTPFASILQSIMHRYWKARHTCPRCSHTWAGEIPNTVMNLRKVDFFWINRDQRSFEWFVSLLSQLEMEQAELKGAMERFLDMHMYITSALQRADMKAVGLQLALDLLHQKEKRDLITGLKTRTNAGRPNWDKVFKQLVAQRKGKLTVFYCGPPQLGRILRST